jgi:hypothetical protein
MEFEQKGICSSKGDSQHFAAHKSDILKIYFHYLDVAQVAAFKLAIFKTCLLKRRSGEVAVGKGTGIVFPRKNVRRCQVLEMLLAKVGHSIF